MTITITNTICTCSDGNISIYNHLNNFLGAKVPNAWHIKSVKEGRWDGIYRFFKMYNKTFGTGLLPKVLAELDRLGIAYTLIDKRTVPTPTLNLHSSIILRPYQERVLTLVKEESRGIIWLPVNSGKTFIAMQLIADLGVKTLWITRSLELLKQTKTLIETNLGVKHVGVIGAGELDLQPITLGMIQTLSKNTKSAKYMNMLSKYFDMIIFDEVHAVAKNTYEKFVSNLDVYYKFGLSGTPKHRSDVDIMSMLAAFGDVIVKMDSKTLEEYGVSVPADINMIKINNPNNSFEYTEAYENLIIYNDARNQIVADMTNTLLQANKQVIIMVDRIAHGEEINRFLDAYGIQAPFIYGEHSIEERQGVIDDFERGKNKVIIASTILNEGMNIYSIDCIIVAGAGMSPIKTIQRVGRVLRKRIGKERALVIDFWDSNNKFLEYHSKQRKRIYDFEFGNVTLIES